MSQKTKLCCNIVIAVGLINFFSFMLFSQYLGGDALNGYQENGRFYVANHGRFTQVSASQWKWNWLQALSLFLTHPLLMFAGFALQRKEKFPALMFRGDPKTRKNKEAEIGSSPLLKATFYCAIKIGQLQLGRKNLKVTIHTKGIHFQPFYMEPFGLLTSEITGYTRQKTYWRKSVEIQHTSPEIATPIVLFFDDDSNAFEKLQEMKQL